MAFNVVLVVLARLVVRRNDASQGSGRLVLQRRHVNMSHGQQTHSFYVFFRCIHHIKMLCFGYLENGSHVLNACLVLLLSNVLMAFGYRIHVVIMLF